MDKYTVIRDSREQKGWIFNPSELCDGTITAGLRTGDYSLVGYENQFVVERKRNTGEIAQNMFQDRFERELERLEDFALPFIICEFTLKDVFNFPHDSGIPQSRWKTLRATPNFIMKRLADWQVQYKTRFIFAGEYGFQFMNSLFKRVVETIKCEGSGTLNPNQKIYESTLITPI